MATLQTVCNVNWYILNLNSPNGITGKQKWAPHLELLLAVMRGSLAMSHDEFSLGVMALFISERLFAKRYLFGDEILRKLDAVHVYEYLRQTLRERCLSITDGEFEAIRWEFNVKYRLVCCGFIRTEPDNKSLKKRVFTISFHIWDK